jgi:GDSL-like Lipase/Acylhydrolase family
VILPLGDSITDGYSTPGGYRTKLYNDMGGMLKYAGSQVNGPTSLPDRHNEGHSGYRIDQIDGDINGLVSSSPAPDTNNNGYWLTGGNNTGRDGLHPDIVLLHIGTNDATQNASPITMESRLTTLLGDLKTDLPDTQFIVASLILRTDSATDEHVQEIYNAAMPNIVASFGDHFHFLNMHSVLVASDLADGVHPTPAGYDKMADAWYGAIESLPEPGATSIAVIIGLVGLKRRRRTS